MKLKKIFVVAVFGVSLVLPKRVIAVSDPLAVTNNKVGVHVLGPGEIGEAAKLVNGEWGYIVVPIQATDRDRVKWGEFMKQAAQLKVIPIIRVATLVTDVHWEEPNNYDLIDFANFLNDLQWPTKNRYVIIFNEVNRADEYGGYVSPEKYAEILDNATRIFHSRNEDFFVMPAGLDMAAANNGESLNWRQYWSRVFAHKPEIVNSIDGWVSHAYPNFAFAGSVYDRHDHSIRSYEHELKLLTNYTERKLPVFITETGWDQERVGQTKAAENLGLAYTQVWSKDSRVVTVAPFLLHANGGPFEKFSMLNNDMTAKDVYQVWHGFVSEGQPELATPISTISTRESDTTGSAPEPSVWNLDRLERMILKILQWLGVESPTESNKVVVGEKTYSVEIMDTPAKRAQGLSGREKLGNDEGMLFLFDSPTRPGFWMPNMKFDIDIVWIVGDEVVGVSRGDRTKPTKQLFPPESIDKVLEVNVDSGIQAGDKIDIIDL